MHDEASLSIVPEQLWSDRKLVRYKEYMHVIDNIAHK